MLQQNERIFSVNQNYNHSGIAEVDGKRIWVEYYFVDSETIECRTFTGKTFTIHYKSIVE